MELRVFEYLSVSKLIYSCTDIQLIGGYFPGKQAGI